ncbi:unnamed protein product [Gemmataceae bacterium]|nr:unnamed protein product [Gemmataceae bacterium]VTU00987.1 unnamed protein product [Gemmataceae bacterium]
MADTKTPTPRSDVTLADVQHGSVATADLTIPDPMPPIAPRPGFPLTLRDLLTSIFTDGPTWAKIVVAVALILAGALGHKCVEPAPAPVLPAPVNVQPTPVNVTVQSPAVAGWKVTKEPFAVVPTCHGKCQCDAGECECPPGSCPHTDCKEGHGPRPPTANTKGLRDRVPTSHAPLNDRMRARLVERLQESGYATAGGDATPLTEEQALRAVGKLTEEQVDAAGKAVGAWKRVGEGGGLLGWIKATLVWIRDHPEQVEKWLRFLLTILMFL